MGDMNKTVKAKPNQTIWDVATEQYGTCEAVGEILANNLGLQNGAAALTALGIETVGVNDFYLDAALEPGTEITIDTDSPHMRPAVVKEIKNDITTYKHGS